MHSNTTTLFVICFSIFYCIYQPDNFANIPENRTAEGGHAHAAVRLPIVTGCEAFPASIPTQSSADSVCSGEIFTLNFDYPDEDGIIYKWYQSGDGLYYMLVPGAIGPVLNTAIASNTYFKCKLICSYTGAVIETTPVLVKTFLPAICGYCPAGYIYGSVEGDYIANVTLNEINNSTGFTPGASYIYYDDIEATITKGITQEIEVTVGPYPEGNSFTAWIDFNHDFAFSFDEIIAFAFNIPASTTTNATFNIPATAFLGETRMRIRETFNLAIIDDCSTYDYGETEDYLINIQEANPPIADFNYSGDPLVHFTDNSEGIVTGWMWNFDDGISSTLPNPDHLFTENGIYNVCLTVENMAGFDSKCKNITITQFLAPEVHFTHDGDPTVMFLDLSLYEPDSWFWSFGDGASSTEQNPTHTYLENGSYAACLFVENDYGSASLCQTVIINGYLTTPVANFDYSGDPFAVFTDVSTGVPDSWEWNFGDGTSSTEQNPTHYFNLNGTYNVCLTVGNAAGINTKCEIIIIDNHIPPVSAFDYSGDPDVIFIDLSSNMPDSWLWDFGDGTFSTEQNPEHTYFNNGIYTVCLTSANGGGVSTNCEPVTITGCLPAPVCAFNYTVNDNVFSFTDLSVNTPNQWFWEFGDGQSSEMQNPEHIYFNPGNYEVCLTVTNSTGTTQCCDNINTALNAITNQNFSDWSIYPNPANSVCYVQMPVSNTAWIQHVELINMTGQQWQLPAKYLESGLWTINIADLPSGIYFIKLINDKNSWSTRRLIIY